MTRIQSHPDAPLGSVLSLPSYCPADFPPTAVILCRNTAPLVSFAFSLIRRNVGCRVLGREIGQGLVQLIKKLDARDIPQLVQKLEMYETRECERFLRKNEEQAAENVRDRVQCITIFASTSDTVSDLCSKITQLFDDTNRGILTLSTVHKAKGLEWPMVFILDKEEYMPSKFARQPWQMRQERNLLYVALTRAQLDLRYIKTGQWKAEGKQLTELQSLTLED